MIYNLPTNLKSKIIQNYDLSRSNWFQTGGKADVYCNVYNCEELKIILSFIPYDIPIFILGAGSNVLIRNGGFRGVIIKLGKGFNNILDTDEKLIVGAGVLDSNLSKYALNNSISNLEFYSGIPGTIGGAVKMNAGCFSSETREVIKSVVIINRLGEEKILNISDLKFDYRYSSVGNDTIIKEVSFHYEKDDFDKIKLRMDNIIKERNVKQPLKTKTGGSTFKNPKGLYAAKLIEESGCKGMQVGGAVVSSKHSNFIINSENASSKDIEDLGEKIREQVYKKFNLNLEWEIKIIGEKE